MKDIPLYIPRPKTLFERVWRKLKKPSIDQMYFLKAIAIGKFRMVKVTNKICFVTISAHELVRDFEQVPRSLHVCAENMPAKIQGITFSGVIIDEFYNPDEVNK